MFNKIVLVLPILIKPVFYYYLPPPSTAPPPSRAFEPYSAGLPGRHLMMDMRNWHNRFYLLLCVVMH